MTRFTVSSFKKHIEAQINGRHFADIFTCIFLNENVWIPIKVSLKFVPKGQINNIPAMVQIMAWRRPGDKPLSEPMMVSLPTHICVVRPQWVKHCSHERRDYTWDLVKLYLTSQEVVSLSNGGHDMIQFEGWTITFVLGTEQNIRVFTHWCLVIRISIVRIGLLLNNLLTISFLH